MGLHELLRTCLVSQATDGGLLGDDVIRGILRVQPLRQEVL